MTRPVAYLAPEIPSVSATFVYREILALREGGLPVRPFSVRRVQADAIAQDGRSLAPEVDVLYERPLRLLADLAGAFVRRPLRSLATLATAARDALRGTFARPSQRLRVPLQALAGLALGSRLARADVAHLHVHFANAPATVAMYASQATGIPFSITAHANDLYVEGSLLAEKARRSTGLATISEVNRRFLRGLPGVPHEQVHVVRCGVDTRSFEARTQTPGGPVRLLAVGRLVGKKGFDLLLRALAERSHALPEWRLDVIGGGPEEERLERLAIELDLFDRVEFHGARPTSEVRGALAAATAFVLPCRRDPSGDVDGIPVALMEAMASGVPVISTALSGIPELIEDGEDGWLAQPGDVASLADVLERALADEDACARVVGPARRRVERDYDQRRNAARLSRLFAGVASLTPPPVEPSARPLETRHPTQV